MSANGLRSCLSVLLMVSVCLGSSGCSLIFVQSPPERPSRYSRVVQCTSSNVAPGFDTVFAGLEGVRTGLAVAADDADYVNTPISRGADIALGVGFMALFIGSAAYGFSSTSRCRAMKADLELDAAQD